MPSSERLHILIVNNYTGRGGVPKAVAALANAMAGRGHRVTVYSQRPVPRFFYPLYRAGYWLYAHSLPDGRRPDFQKGTQHLQEMYALHNGVDVRSYSFTDNNKKVQALRKEIVRLDPDVCVCPFPDGAHLVWAATLMGSSIPYVYSERTSPGAIEGIFWNRPGRLAAMSGADAIHLLLPGYKKSIPDFLQERVHVIPNAVTLPKQCAKVAGQAGQKKVLLWLGRLHDEIKQCRLAMDAFALLAKKFPDWEMHIAGDGPDKKVIHAHAAVTGLGERIRFLGEIRDVWAVYAASQAYCFSSRLEGMPNGLLEAMAAGLPCVTFKKCEGLDSIIQHEVNGLFAEEMTAHDLAQQLQIVMQGEQTRVRLGAQARETAKAFSEEAVFAAWEDLLRGVAAHKGNTVMDAFGREPFASMARLSARSRQEWAIRNFGEPMPGSIEYEFFLQKKRLVSWLHSWRKEA